MKLVLKGYPNGQVSVYTERMSPGYGDRPETLAKVRSRYTRSQLLICEYLPIIGAQAILEVERQKRGTPGLVNGSQFASRVRRVAKALTRHGRRSIESAMVIIERMFRKNRLSFLTLTISPEVVAAALRNPDGLRAATRDLRNRLQKKLARAGLPDFFAGVCEIHPHRSEREGIAIPHWHFCFVGRHPGKTWEVSPNWVDEVWRNSLARNGLIPADVNLPAACRIETVQKSLRRYMSKYLSKGNHVPESVEEVKYFSLLPGQLHYISRKLIKEIRRNTIVISGSAAETVHGVIKENAMHLVRVQGTVDFIREDGSKHVLVWWYFLTDLGMKTLGLL